MASQDWNEPIPIPSETFQDDVDQLRMIAATHEGQLRGIDGGIAAVQSTMQAWANTAIGVGAAIGVAIAVLAGLQYYVLARMDTGFKDANDHFAKLDDRMTSIEVEVKTLPAAVSQQMLSVAASLATVRGNPPAPPPAPPPQPQR